MKIVFLGVGEACDEMYPNTSCLIKAEQAGYTKSILLDCGFTVPPLYWQQTTNPEDLDAVWISHFHGDHFFGLPALILRFWEQERLKPLVIVGQDGIQQVVEGAMELAYPGFLKKLTYPLQFMTAQCDRVLDAVGFRWEFAKSAHGQTNLAVRLGDGKRSVFYSGDGLPTPETLALAREADLIIHEAFRLNEDLVGHGTVRRCIKFAREAGAPVLVLLHVQRDERRERFRDILDVTEGVKDFRIVVPQPGEFLEI